GPLPPATVVPPAGEVVPVSRTCLSVACLLFAAVPASAADAPSFVNDVSPILTRYGCNEGACHGKGAGQNGFRLSLRGYAPELDYLWLTREYDARRVSRANPEEGLLLRKPLGLAPHEGGKLMSVGDRSYQVLLAWLRAGTPGPDKKGPEVRRLEVTPARRTLRPGQEQQLAVCAEYSDGSRRDVTW